MLGILFNLTLGFGLGGVIATSLMLLNGAVPSKNGQTYIRERNRKYDFSGTRFEDADRHDIY